MRILYVASAYTKEEAFLSVCNSLERMGHSVDYLPVHMESIMFGRDILGVKDDSRDREAKIAGVEKLNALVIEKSKQADLVIFWKGELLRVTTIAEVSRNTNTIYYVWDDPYEIEINKDSLLKGSSCRVVASCCAKSTARYFSDKTLWLPPGFDPSVHYEDGKPEVDVCFIGTNTYCRELYGEGIDAPFDRRDLVQAALEVTEKVELWGRGNEPLGWLHPVHGDPSFAPYFKGFIKFNESRKAYSRAKVIVNSHVRRNGYKYVNERTLQILGCGRAQLIDNNPGTSEVLSRDCTILYDSLGEFKSKLKDLIGSMSYETTWREMGKSALEASKDFTWDVFCQKLLEAAK